MTAAVDEREQVVTFRFFPARCAETTKSKQLLAFLANTMVLVVHKSFGADEVRQLHRGNGRLTGIPHLFNGTSH
jgi:hypothetical protein